MGTDKTWTNPNYYTRKAQTIEAMEEEKRYQADRLAEAERKYRASTPQQSTHSQGIAQATPSHTHVVGSVTTPSGGYTYTVRDDINTYQQQPIIPYSPGLSRDDVRQEMEMVLERHREMLEEANKSSLEQWVLEHPEARKLLEHALASDAPHASAGDEYNKMVSEMHDLLHLLDSLYASKDHHTIPTPAWAAIGAAADTIRRLRDLPRVTLPRYFQHPWGTMDDVEEGMRMSTQDCQACWYIDLFDGPVPRCLDCGAQASQCRCGHGAHIGPCAGAPAPQATNV